MVKEVSDSLIFRVVNWLQDKLEKKDTYESVEWSDIVQVNVPPYRYIVYHKFKHENKNGYKIRCSITFYLDKAGDVVNFHEWDNMAV